MYHFAVIGNPISHSLSPVVHTTALNCAKLKGVYETLLVEDVASKIPYLRTLSGFNVTLPHKETIMGHLDFVEPTALKIGAVNCVFNNDGRLEGYNTDMDGAMLSLLEHTSLKGKEIVVLGAGGSARALVYGLTTFGAHVTVLNRTVEKAQRLSQEFKCSYGGLEHTLRGNILVNTLPMGMQNKGLTIDTGSLSSFELVYDIVYTPAETPLLKEAKKKGCKILNGLDMFINQAALSFTIWTGKEANKAMMKEAALKELCERYGRQ